MASVTLAATGADANSYWDFAAHKDGVGNMCLFGVNGATYAAGYGQCKIYWNAGKAGGANWDIAEIAGTPKPPVNKIIRNYLGRLWMGGNTEASTVQGKRALIYSNVDADIEKFPYAPLAIQSPGGSFSSMDVWERDLFVFLEENVISIPFALVREDYREVDLGLGWGCVAPYTLRRCGSHGLVCLSDKGVKEFPSQRTLSGAIDRTLWDLDDVRKRAAYAFYYAPDDTYDMLIGSGTAYSTILPNDNWWQYRFADDKWSKPDVFPYRSMGCVVNYGAQRRLLMGDYTGRTWQHHCGAHAGKASDIYAGAVTTGGTTTFSDSAATFPTTGNGLKQMPAYIITGQAIGQRREITANTATQITVPIAFSPAVAIGDVYMIGVVRGRLETPWMNMGDRLRFKRFGDLRILLDKTTDGVSKPAAAKNCQLNIYRDFETTAAKTITTDFTENYAILPIDTRAKHLKLVLDIFETGQTGIVYGSGKSPQFAIRSIRLGVELQTYS